MPDIARLDVTWLHRGNSGVRPGAMLEERLHSLAWSQPGAQIWIAAESATIHALRLFLTRECGIARSAMHLSGYWKLGAAATEREADSDY